MKFGKSLLMLTSALGALFSLSLAAVAQEQQEQERAESETTRIGEIVVTAEKRAASVQDVPVAITAFTAELRETTGIESATQQLNFTPGVNYDQYKVTVRGIGNDPIQTLVLGLDPGVSLYQDGVFITPPPYVGINDIGDSPMAVSRVEILRGPQGTLYGRNSLGGALNRISNRPGDEFEAEVRGSYNSYDRMRGEARIAGPLMEHLRGSLMATVWDQSEGYFESRAGVGDAGGNGFQTSIDAQLGFDFGPSFEGWVRYTTLYSNTSPLNASVANGVQRPGYGNGALASFANLDPVTGAPAGLATSTPNPVLFSGLSGYYGHTIPNGLIADAADYGLADARTFFSNTRATSKTSDYHLWIADLVWHADNVDLRYVGGYNTWRNTYIADYDGTGALDYLYPYQVPVSFDPSEHPYIFYSGIAGYQPWSFDSDITTTGDVYDPADPLTQPEFQTIHGDGKTIQPADFRAYSHELTLTSTSESAFQWILGAYYYQEFGSRTSHRYFFDEPLFGGAPQRVIESFQHLQTDSYGLYGQLDYDISETLHFTFGLRYNHDHKEGDEGQLITHWIPALVDTDFNIATPALPVNVFYNTCGAIGCDDGGTPSDATDPIILGPNGELMTTAWMDDTALTRGVTNTWDALTGTVGLQWSPNRDSMGYVRYSRGYKSGGYNLGFATALAGLVGKPEFVDAYEIGWKQTWDAFQLNTAVYYNRYENAQVYALDTTSGVILLALANVKSAEIYGLELEGSWAPNDNWFFLASYAYADSEIINPGFTALDLNNPPVTFNGVSQGGNEMPQTPHHKIGLNGTYTMHFDDDSTLALSTTLNYKDSYFSTIYNGLSRVPEATTADFRATWRVNERFALVGSVTNITNEDVKTYVDPGLGAPLGINSTTNYYSDPRIFTLEAQFRF